MLRRSVQFLRRHLLEEILFLVIVVFLVVQQPDPVAILTIVISYIVLILLLNSTFFSRGAIIGLGDIPRVPVYGILVLMSIALLFIWQFSYEAIIFLTIFIIFAVYGWDSRIITTGALIFLASCPFLLIFKQNPLAEQMAVYAFFFLTMTVVLQIIEHKRFPGRYSEDENK